MDKDRIAGSAKDFAGKVEGVVGDIAGDAKTQAAAHFHRQRGRPGDWNDHRTGDRTQSEVHASRL